MSFIGLNDYGVEGQGRKTEKGKHNCMTDLNLGRDEILRSGRRTSWGKWCNVIGRNIGKLMMFIFRPDAKSLA